MCQTARSTYLSNVLTECVQLNDCGQLSCRMQMEDTSIIISWLLTFMNKDGNLQCGSIDMLQYIRDVIQKSWQRRKSMISHVLKLHNQLLLQFIINCCNSQRTCFIRKKVAVVRALKMKFQIWNNTMQWVACCKLDGWNGQKVFNCVINTLLTHTHTSWMLYSWVFSPPQTLKMIGKGFVLFKINSSPSAFYIIKPTCIVIGF